MRLSVFLPCRAGSERVPKKNTKKFGRYKGGLLEKKLMVLSEVPSINEIIVSTDDRRVIEIADSFKNNSKDIIIDKRPKQYCSNSTTTDSLIKYVRNRFKIEHILWTHVTSPFITSSEYAKIINMYNNCLARGYDSLMTVSRIQSFIWDEEKPLNYDRNKLKWPMTQKLPIWYEVDSAVFIAHLDIYKKHLDRVGKSIFLYKNSKLSSFDVDWVEDFELAEMIELYHSNT